MMKTFIQKASYVLKKKTKTKGSTVSLCCWRVWDSNKYICSISRPDREPCPRSGLHIKNNTNKNRCTKAAAPICVALGGKIGKNMDTGSWAEKKSTIMTPHFWRSNAPTSNAVKCWFCCTVKEGEMHRWPPEYLQYGTGRGWILLGLESYCFYKEYKLVSKSM